MTALVVATGILTEVTLKEAVRVPSPCMKLSLIGPVENIDELKAAALSMKALMFAVLIPKTMPASQ